MDLASQPIDVLQSGAAVLSGGTALRGQKTQAQMAAAAKDFESVFMAQMLKPMWSGVETDSMFGGGAGEDVMRDLLLQEYGKSMAQADGYGLSNAVMDMMIRMQDQTQGLQGGQHA